MTTGNVVYSLRFFTYQNAEPDPRFKLRLTAGESSMLTARLHMLYKCHKTALNKNNIYSQSFFRFQVTLKINMIKSYSDARTSTIRDCNICKMCQENE